MNKFFGMAAAVAFGVAMAGSANAAVVTFDDLLADVGGGPFSDQGLTFSSSDPTFFYVWGGDSPNSNGTNNLIQGFDGQVTITRTGGGVFDLKNLDLAISWYSDLTNDQVLVNGNPLAITNTLTNYALNLTGVSSVTISALQSGSGYWTLDNVAFTGGAVPEPATWALMIGGFGLAGATLRRRRMVAIAA